MHVIFNYKDKNLLIKRDITCKVSVVLWNRTAASDIDNLHCT